MSSHHELSQHVKFDVENTPARHEISALLQYLATSLLERYLRAFVVTGLIDLAVSIDVFQLASRLRPSNHPHRSYTLNNLAIAIFFRYNVGRNGLDLSRAIALHREALRLQQPKRSDHSSSATHLANASLKRLERHGGDIPIYLVIGQPEVGLNIQPPGNLDQSQMEQTTQTGTSTYSAQHGSALEGLRIYDTAIACIQRYESEGGLAILTKSIQLFRSTLLLFSPGDPIRVAALSNLGSAILARYEQGGREQDLSDAIELQLEALSLRPPGHPNRSASLCNLANAMLKRYERFGGEHDLSNIIELHKEALSLQPPGSRGRFAPLTNLANTLHARFKRTGNEQDLSDTVQLRREALSLQPNNHPYRSLSLSNLASTILTRYERDGRERDLSEVIELHREALSLLPINHTERSLVLSNLANAVLMRYTRDHEEQDLLDVIKLYKDALALIPPGHLRRAGSLSNLASATCLRYEWCGGTQDLSDVIELEREALSLRPVNHPDRSLSLNNLAHAIIARYRRDREEQDLSDVIKLRREALLLRPPGDSRRSSSLSNLASAILMRYGRHGGKQDLLDGIELRREALSLRPPGHPQRSSSLSDLADAIMAGYGKYGVKQGPAFVEEINHLLRNAAAAETSPMPVRLQAALKWIDLAVICNKELALEAYQSAFSLMGGAMTLGRSLQARHSNLLSQDTRSRSTKRLALDAALWALTSTPSSTKLAIELLDQGRNVLLASVGRFRAELSDIRREDPALAEEFYRTSRLLDLAISTGEEITAERSTYEDPTSRYKRVSAKWEAVVAKIRLLPGCESFLLPMPYLRLQEAAVDGPVIVIVVGKERSTAIIVKSIGEPREINLSRASEEALKELYGELDDILGAIPNAGPALQKMRYILSDLWDILVQPIIHALQDILLVPTGSRIWWYPTSWASFLPLHAAGSYKNSEPNVPDLYISSYTPTLQALRRSRSRFSYNTDRSAGALIVSQAHTPGQIELPCVNDEVRVVSSLASNALILSDDEGTKQRVLEELRSHPWIHLACHGDSDPSDPFKSHFALHDGPLSLQDIITNDLPSADFAFLSACHSAAQDRTLPDEGLALAGGMHFAGFKSVVGTLWGMADDDAPTLARKFYKGLAERSGDGKPFDCTKTAEALHDAVQELRKKKVPLFRWVNLVHYGI